MAKLFLLPCIGIFFFLGGCSWGGSPEDSLAPTPSLSPQEREIIKEEHIQEINEAGGLAEKEELLEKYSDIVSEEDIFKKEEEDEGRSE